MPHESKLIALIAIGFVLALGFGFLALADPQLLQRVEAHRAARSAKVAEEPKNA